MHTANEISYSGIISNKNNPPAERGNNDDLSEDGNLYIGINTPRSSVHFVNNKGWI